MPHEHIARMREVLGNSGDIMVPASDADVTSMAMIHALRAQTDVLDRIAKRQDKFEEGMGDIGSTLHSIDKRLHVIENSTIERDIKRNSDRLDRHSARIDALEDAEQRREGAVGLAKFIKDWGPWVVALFAAVVALVRKGVL